MRLGDFKWATLSLILKSLSYFEYHIKFYTGDINPYFEIISFFITLISK